MSNHGMATRLHTPVFLNETLICQQVVKPRNIFLQTRQTTRRGHY